jgi:hypothetical protein
MVGYDTLLRLGLPLSPPLNVELRTTRQPPVHLDVNLRPSFRLFLGLSLRVSLSP